MSSAISYNCPHCSGEMTYAPEHRGMNSQCPLCHKEIILGKVLSSQFPAKKSNKNLATFAVCAVLILLGGAMFAYVMAHFVMPHYSQTDSKAAEVKPPLTGNQGANQSAFSRISVKILCGPFVPVLNESAQATRRAPYIPPIVRFNTPCPHHCLITHVFGGAFTFFGRL